MISWQLAQVNVGTLLTPEGDPRVQPFFDTLARIHAMSVEAGTQPTIADGLSRLSMIDRYGPSSQAFTFKSLFPAPGEAGGPMDHKPDPWCVGHA